MLTTLALSIAVIFCSGACAAAFLDATRTERQKQAADVWRVTTLRNGVTAESPFSPLSSSINSPGLVEVHPRTRTYSAALSTAPVPASVRVEPLPTKVESPVESSDEEPKVSTTKETPFRWGYPQGSYSADSPPMEAITTLHRLIDDGERRKTVLSWAVFGSNGGSVYSTAKPIIEEALSNAD
jgi:hypothetical protein